MSEAVAPAPGKDSRGGGGLSLRRKRALIPLLFVLPGLAWLILFYAIPIVSQVWVSTQTGNPDDGFVQTWNFSVYPEAVSEYLPHRGRSVLYAGIDTLACQIISVRLAVVIACQAERWRDR
ncbi:MAG: ABC transporter permease, partial [Solirubrobacterales bacterium]